MASDSLDQLFIANERLRDILDDISREPNNHQWKYYLDGITDKQVTGYLRKRGYEARIVYPRVAIYARPMHGYILVVRK